MSARLAWTVRRNAYFDSIDLMQIAEQARPLAGVIDVALVMGTPGGRSMLEEAGMWSPEAPGVPITSATSITPASGRACSAICMRSIESK